MYLKKASTLSLKKALMLGVAGTKFFDQYVVNRLRRIVGAWARPRKNTLGGREFAWISAIKSPFAVFLPLTSRSGIHFYVFLRTMPTFFGGQKGGQSPLFLFFCPLCA